MALDAGDDTIQPGTLARKIYDNMQAAFGDPGDSASTWRAIASAVANAVVDHFTENAEVTATIATSLGGLQRYGVGLADTDPPSATKTIPGTVA